MDQDVKAKWVAALRSGEYKQTQKFLSDDYGFCCLGVLCKVMGVSADDPTGDIDDPPYDAPRAAIGDDNCSILAGKNDDGASFLTIANYIEAIL